MHFKKQIHVGDNQIQNQQQPSIIDTRKSN